MHAGLTRVDGAVRKQLMTKKSVKQGADGQSEVSINNIGAIVKGAAFQAMYVNAVPPHSTGTLWIVENVICWLHVSV